MSVSDTAKARQNAIREQAIQNNDELGASKVILRPIAPKQISKNTATSTSIRGSRGGRVPKTSRSIKKAAEPYKKELNNGVITVENISKTTIEDSTYLKFPGHLFNVSKCDFDLPLHYNDIKVLDVFIPKTTAVFSNDGSAESIQVIQDNLLLNKKYGFTVLVLTDLYTLLYANKKVLIRSRSSQIYSAEINSNVLNKYNMQNELGSANMQFNLFYIDKFLQIGDNSISVKYRSCSNMTAHNIQSPYLQGPSSATDIIRALDLRNISIFIVLGVNESLYSLHSAILLNHKLSKKESVKRIRKMLNNKDEDFSVESTDCRLVDPITLNRIEFPVRFKQCPHSDCFDVSTLCTVRTSTKNNCFVCNRDISTKVTTSDFEFTKSSKALSSSFYESYSKSILNMLVFDEYVDEIIRSTDKDVVKIDQQGNWSNVIENHNVIELVDLPGNLSAKKNGGQNEVIDLTGDLQELKGMTGEIINLC
eukprot:NODE_154_length_16838_cov_0.293327.p3 type:complete len:478 gc:universal NODE_154_length_16838_cov_0.293327:14399-12966(-)